LKSCTKKGGKGDRGIRGYGGDKGIGTTSKESGKRPELSSRSPGKTKTIFSSQEDRDDREGSEKHQNSSKEDRKTGKKHPLFFLLVTDDCLALEAFC
jgi:hypothetical protein